MRNRWWFGGVVDRDRLTNIDMALPDRLGTAPPDDLELVRRARDGDPTAYGELVRRHQGVALRVAAGICGSTEEARDIVQEALVKGYRTLDSFRADGPVRAWLLRIVANDAKNAVRARSRRQRRETTYESTARPLRLAEVDADGPIVDGDEAARLLEVLATLPARDREVLAHRYVAGLTEQETADALGVAVGTVKSRTARALGRARQALGETDHG